MSRSLHFHIKVALGIWALVFFAVIAPIAFLYNWRVGTFPVVEATLSNQRVVEMRVGKTLDLFVKATLAFDGPFGHCKHDDVRIGSTPYRGGPLPSHVQLAARTDSCHGYFLLPLNTPSLAAWIGVFLFFSLFLAGFATVTYYKDYKDSARKVDAINAPSPS